jgi:hypothetical protein
MSGTIEFENKTTVTFDHKAFHRPWIAGNAFESWEPTEVTFL